jgi:thioredoxin 1
MNQYLIVNALFIRRCGPCRAIAPIFETLSEKYTNVVFVKVDVDELADVASKCGIRAMPTFQFYKGGSKIKEMCGANQAQLVSMIEECSTL